MVTITTHCLVKNEENFIWYAVKSVIDYVDQVFIFDTGSTDNTVSIVKGLVEEYPDKIVFEEKGKCDLKRHTELRQEMINRTTTDWFIILDGDEVWTKALWNEILETIKNKKEIVCLVAPYYLCVGDIYHYSRLGNYNILNRFGNFSTRCFKNELGIHWSGDYGHGDDIFNLNNEPFFNLCNTFFLRNKYWHASALIRSSKDNDIELGLGRYKQVMTYSLKFFGRGYKIKEDVPEVFINNPSLVTEPLTLFKSIFNLLTLILFKLKIFKKRFYL